MIQRIGNVEFFAALPAGTYLLCVILLLVGVDFSALTEAPIGADPNLMEGSLWIPLASLGRALGETPIFLAVGLFAAYLLGITLRVLRVSWAQTIVAPTKDRFPNKEVVRSVLEKLGASKAVPGYDVDRSPPKGEEVCEVIFNYWKNVLCNEAPSGFAYYQVAEARSRFFASMIWASILGVLGGVALLFKDVPDELWSRATPLMASAVLLAVFASQFTRVRNQEARALTSLYVAHLQRTPSTPTQPEDVGRTGPRGEA